MRRGCSRGISVTGGTIKLLKSADAVDLAGAGGEHEEMRRGRTGPWRSRGRGRRRRSRRRSRRMAGGGGHKGRRAAHALAALEVSTTRCCEADWALGVTERQLGVVLVLAESSARPAFAGVSDIFKDGSVLLGGVLQDLYRGYG
jgi:hypothetical protein